MHPEKIIQLAESLINTEFDKPTIYAHEQAMGIKYFAQWLLKNGYEVVKTEEIELLPVMETINPNNRVEILWTKINELIRKL